MSHHRMGSHVLVIDSDGSNLGSMSYTTAQRIAHQQGLDLVQVGDNAGLPVCKIMDRGKWNYQQKKRAKKLQQSHHPPKEIRMSMRIERHDENIKIEQMRRFLQKGLQVRFVIEMHGRERSNTELAVEKAANVIQRIEDCGSHEPVKVTKTNVSTMLYPRKDSVRHVEENNATREVRKAPE